MQKQQSLLEQALQTARKSFYFVGLFSFFINILMLTVPIYMLQLFDRVLASRSYDTLIFITIIALVALAVFGLLDVARSRILVHLSRWLDNVLSPAGLAKSADELLLGGNYGAQVLQNKGSGREIY